MQKLILLCVCSFLCTGGLGDEIKRKPLFTRDRVVVSKRADYEDYLEALQIYQSKVRALVDDEGALDLDTLED